jgi:hypothetical protein
LLSDGVGPNGECRRVRCIEGPAVWKTVDDGWVDAEVMDAVYAAVPHSKTNIREDAGAVLFQFEYVDGFRGSLFMLPSAGLSGAAVRLKGQPTLATAFEERPDPSYPHFAWLLKAIEAMVHRGRPEWPVERTLLTGGILDRALRSRHAGGTMLDTPELQIAYNPVTYPCATFSPICSLRHDSRCTMQLNLFAKQPSCASLPRRACCGLEDSPCSVG